MSQNELITSPRRGCKASLQATLLPSFPTLTHRHGWVSVPTRLCWGCLWISLCFLGSLGAACVRNKQRLLSRVSCTLKGKVVNGNVLPPETRWEKVSQCFPPRHHFLWVTLGSGIVCCFPMAESCEIFYGALVVSYNLSPKSYGWESTVTLAPCGELPQPWGRNILSFYRQKTLHSDFF